MVVTVYRKMTGKIIRVQCILLILVHVVKYTVSENGVHLFVLYVKIIPPHT